MNKTKKSVSLPSMEQVEGEKKRLKHKAAYKKALSGTIYVLVVVAAVSVLISSLILPVLQISGDSMEPTLHSGEIVVAIKTKNFETGDLCCFSWNNRTLIKRVIAGPGEWVDIKDDGTVYVNYKKIEEPYVTGKSLGETDLTYPYQVPENSYFVLGDQRETSIDSRNTVIGCIYKDQFIGKVQFRIWPFTNIGFVSE